MIFLKAAIYKGKKNIELATLPTPHAGENDVVIQNIFAGICGSDVAVYNHGTNTGHKVGNGHEFGHEAVSRVVEVGKNISDFTVGQRVYPYPLYARGDPKRAGSMGAFSEYILVPNAQLNHSLYIVPENISDKKAAMIEPFTVGTCTARHTHPEKGNNAIIYGAGTIGLAAAVALKHFGVEKIIVIDHSAFRLNIAHKLGLETINSTQTDVKTRAIEILGAAFGLKGDCPNADIFMDAVGRNEILNDFIEFGKIDSRFVAVGVNNQKPDFNLLDLIYGSKSIGGSGGYRPRDVKTVMEIMSNSKYDLEQLITAEVDWQHLESGIQQATDVNHALKVLVNYHNS